MKTAVVSFAVIVTAIMIAGAVISSQMFVPGEDDTTLQGGDVTQPQNVTSGAQVSIWDGTVKMAVANSGIYLIEDASQLAWLAESTNDGSMNGFTGSKIVLMSDIDLDNKEWTPIGTSEQPFSGTFDGNGHTISNIHCSDASSDYVGLFGYTDGGRISDLSIEKVDVVGSEFAEALVNGRSGFLLAVIADPNFGHQKDFFAGYTGFGDSGAYAFFIEIGLGRVDESVADG